MRKIASQCEKQEDLIRVILRSHDYDQDGLWQKIHRDQLEIFTYSSAMMAFFVRRNRPFSIAKNLSRQTKKIQFFIEI